MLSSENQFLFVIITHLYIKIFSLINSNHEVSFELDKGFPLSNELAHIVMKPSFCRFLLPFLKKRSQLH